MKEMDAVPPVNLEEYKIAVGWLEKGLYEKVSEFLRVKKGDGSILARLLKFRLQLKNGCQNLDPSLLRSHLKEMDLYTSAEAYFVLGLYGFQALDFQFGSDSFFKAASLYKQLGEARRELMSLFNSIIGKVNLRPDGSLDEYFDALQDLERLARHYDEKRMVGIVRRQKSYFYLSLGKPFAALVEIVEALPLLELYCPKSDFHLALLHAADCALDAEKNDEARAWFEKVLPALDHRIEFPYAFIRARLENGTVHPSRFPIVIPHWKKRFDKVMKPKTDLSSHIAILVCASSDGSEPEFYFGSTTKEPHWRIKTRGLEGRLLALLRTGKHSRNLLIERLWPEEFGQTLLDNRLHRLISRVNKKVVQAVQFDGSSYSINTQFVFHDRTG